MERQKLHDHVDSAAHAGAFELPASGAEREDGSGHHDGQEPRPDDDAPHRAVLRRRLHRRQQAGGGRPDPGDVRPGDVLHRPRCGATPRSAPIPCPASRSRCNTMPGQPTPRTSISTSPQSSGGSKGSTGSVASVACKGACGETRPTPWTWCSWPTAPPAWPTADREDMQTAIVDEPRGRWTPTLHYVAFGALHKSKATARAAPRRPPPARRGEGGKWISGRLQQRLPRQPRLRRSAETEQAGQRRQVPARGAVPGLVPGATAPTSPRRSRARVVTCWAWTANNLSSLPKRPGTAEEGASSSRPTASPTSCSRRAAHLSTTLRERRR